MFENIAFVRIAIETVLFCGYGVRKIVFIGWSRTEFKSQVD